MTQLEINDEEQVETNTVVVVEEQAVVVAAANPAKRIKRQRRKLRGKYSGNCLSCESKWSKCWYIASVDNQRDWQTRLKKEVKPVDHEVCFQCWDAKIRTSPKRKQVISLPPALPSEMEQSTTTISRTRSGSSEFYEYQCLPQKRRRTKYMSLSIDIPPSSSSSPSSPTSLSPTTSPTSSRLSSSSDSVTSARFSLSSSTSSIVLDSDVDMEDDEGANLLLAMSMKRCPFPFDMSDLRGNLSSSSSSSSPCSPTSLFSPYSSGFSSPTSSVCSSVSTTPSSSPRYLDPIGEAVEPSLSVTRNEPTLSSSSGWSFSFSSLSLLSPTTTTSSSSPTPTTPTHLTSPLALSSLLSPEEPSLTISASSSSSSSQASLPSSFSSCWQFFDKSNRENTKTLIESKNTYSPPSTSTYCTDYDKFTNTSTTKSFYKASIAALLS